MLKGVGVGTSNPLAGTIPEFVFIMFQMTFAIITPALICGSFAERMKFSGRRLFMGLWLIFVVCVLAFRRGIVGEMLALARRAGIRRA